MKQITIVLILMMSVSLEGQTTKELFTLEGLTFILDNYDDTSNKSERTVHYDKDTLLNGIEYSIYSYDCIGKNYFRFEGGKVFKKEYNDTFILKYDFDAELLDTVTSYLFACQPSTYIIKEKELIEYPDGSKRRKLIVQQLPNLNEWELIEGIGVTGHGPFTYCYTGTFIRCILAEGLEIYRDNEFTDEEISRRSCRCPSASFSIEADEEYITVENTSELAVDNTWRISDGSTYAGEEYSHTFQNGGCYSIAHETTNECGIKEVEVKNYSFCEDSLWVSKHPGNFREVDFVNENKGWGIVENEIVKTNDGGLSWQIVPVDLTDTIDGTIHSLNMIDDQIGIFVHLDGAKSVSEVYITTNGGLDWASSLFNGNSLCYASITSQGIAVASSGSRMFRTINFGLTWEQLDKPYVRAEHDLKMYENGTIVTVNFILDYTPPAGGRTTILVSRNFGDSWNETLMPKDTDMNTASFVDDITGYAVGDNKVYKTEDGGFNWFLFKTIDGDLDINHLSLDASGNSVLISRKKVFTSFDDMENFNVEYCKNNNFLWKPFVGFGNMYILSPDGLLKREPDTNYDCTVVDVEEKNKVFSVHPNPTTGLIQFELPNASTYNYSIFDIKGSVLKTGFLNRYSTIDLTDYDRGLYFVSFELKGEMQQVVKVVKL